MTDITVYTDSESPILRESLLEKMSCKGWEIRFTSGYVKVDKAFAETMHDVQGPMAGCDIIGWRRESPNANILNTHFGNSTTQSLIESGAAYAAHCKAAVTVGPKFERDHRRFDQEELELKGPSYNHAWEQARLHYLIREDSNPYLDRKSFI
ncbi:MAG TPA: hypothetical protein VF719_08525, partial [Abditibacteriaceae bacterium]